MTRGAKGAESTAAGPRGSGSRALALLAHAARAIARRKGKAMALGGGLMFAVMLVAAVLFLADALRNEAERAWAAMPDVVVQRLIGGRPAVFPLADLHELDGIDSVQSVMPRTWGYTFVPSLQGNVTILGTPPEIRPLSLSEGELATGRDLVPGRHEMVAGAGLARFLGLDLGDELGLPSPNPDAPTLRLVGTFSSSVELYTSDVVLCDESDARALLGLGPQEATDVGVTAINPAEAHVIAKTILDRLPGTRVIERSLIGRIYERAYSRRAGLVLAASIPALLAFLVLAWDRANGVGPDEKREIAILKAVGWSTADVLWAKLAEALLVSLVATSLGLTLGYVWVFTLGAPGLRAAIAGWSVLYPRSALTPAVDPGQIFGMLVSVVGPFVTLSIVPAWRAAITDPMETLRG